MFVFFSSRLGILGSIAVSQGTLLICQTPTDAAMATPAVAPNRAG